MKGTCWFSLSKNRPFATSASASMQSSKHRRWLPPVVGLSLFACAFGVHAATGARVVLQAWSPLTPDQANVVTLVDEPTLVSDSLQDAWAKAGPRICEQLKLRMGVGGFANGETLSDIKCLLDEQIVFAVEPAGQNRLRATVAIGGYLEATSTTPTPLGEYANPRVSVALTATLDVILAVQSNRNQTLRVEGANFTLGNAVLDSHNASADVLKFVADDLVPFFGGPNFKNLAEQAVNGLSTDVAGYFNAALVPINATLAGPSDAIRVGVTGNTGYISAAFAPREIAPLTNGRMTGLLRWDPTQFTPHNGCQSFDIRATVQTGPVPMYTPNAVAPTRQVGSFAAHPVDAGSCAFTLSGLASGWPNVLAASVIDGGAAKSSGSSIYRVSFALAGDGWEGRTVVPQPVADSRHYRVSRSIDTTAIKVNGSGSIKEIVRQKTDPRINPADTNTISQKAASGYDTVTLNPQPLPPRDSVLKAQTQIQSAGDDSAIIIVSGKAPLLRTGVPQAQLEAVKKVGEGTPQP